MFRFYKKSFLQTVLQLHFRYFLLLFTEMGTLSMHISCQAPEWANGRFKICVCKYTCTCYASGDIPGSRAPYSTPL